MGDNPEETTDPKSLITEEDTTKALQADKGEGAQLTSFEIVDFTKPGDNYSTYVTSVEVKYVPDGGEDSEVTYVVKVNPCRSWMGMDALEHTLFIKEGNFFLEIVPELNAVLEAAGKEPLRLPKLYYAHLEGKEERLYFEDLRADGFELYNRKKGLDEAHATLVMDELARLHAASCLLEEKYPDETLDAKFSPTLQDWLDLGEAENAILSPCLENHITHAVDILKNVDGYGRAVDWMEALKPNLVTTALSKMKTESFLAICHGDMWSNNLLFKYNDEGAPVEVRMVDLGTCRYGNLTSDLNYLIYTSMTGEDRQAHLHDLMVSYVASFKDVIEAGGLEMKFTEEELLQELRDKNVLGSIFAIFVVPSVIVEADGHVDLSNKDLDLAQAVSDYWSNVSEKIQDNPLLKPRLLAMFDEFMENGLIP